MSTKIIGIVKVDPGKAKAIRPPENEAWEITALAAMGLSFGVRFGNINESTEEVLKEEANLATRVFVDTKTYIIFNNWSSQEKVGFYCGEKQVGEQK